MKKNFPQVSFHRVEQYASRQFREAMRIYRAEFSPATALPISHIRELLKKGDYQLLVAWDERQVLGFALIWICRKPVFVHLDYFAVADKWKGKGLGTQLYRWLTEHLTDFSPRARLLTLEVEDDLIAFYQRGNTHLLQDVPYVFPGLRGPVPMRLMVYDRLGRVILARATVRGVIRGLYCGLHRRDARDPLLQSCLRTVPAQTSLT
jgi:GNAT superfamily N-acetyltransferase